MRTALLVVALVALAAKMLAPAFVVPTPSVSAPVLHAATATRKIPEAQASSSGGWTALAAAGAMAALMGGSRRRARGCVSGSTLAGAPQKSSGGTCIAMQADWKTWRKGKQAPTFNYNGSLKISPPKQKKSAKQRRMAMWLKYSLPNMSNRRRNCYRIARQAVMHALKAKYRARRQFKRDRRMLWIQRVANNSRLHGIKYNKFICRLKEANININRKILSQLGVYDRAIFTNVLETAVPEWRELKEKEENKGKKELMTIQELDDIAIPYIEATIPEIYTDPALRFNRKVQDWGVEYTVDFGDPEEWRDALPKLPEMANFKLPDHLLNNSRRQLEEVPVQQRFKVPDEETDKKYRDFMDKVRKFWEEEEAAAERGEPVRQKKEGISRENWFDEEPQSWF